MNRRGIFSHAANCVKSVFGAVGMLLRTWAEHTSEE